MMFCMFVRMGLFISVIGVAGEWRHVDVADGEIGERVFEHEVYGGTTEAAVDTEVAFFGMFLVEVKEGTELGTAAGNVVVMGDDVFEFLSDFHRAMMEVSLV